MGPRRTSLAVFLTAMLPLAACGSTNPRPGKNGAGDDGNTDHAPAAKAQFDLYAFGRVLGTMAPCGCTTEPLGGLQYAFGLLTTDSRDSARLVIEPGSFLFPDPDGPEWPTTDATWAQAEKRATALQTRFSQLGDALASGVGPIDLRSPSGAAALSAHPLPRVLANLDTPAAGVSAPPTSRHVTLRDAGITLPIGITAVIDPTLPHANAIGTLGDPVAALEREIPKLRKAGAQVTVALVHGPRPFVETIARHVQGLDIAVVGVVDGLQRARLGTPMAKIGDTFVLEPGEQLQTVSHLRLVVDPSAGNVPTSDAWTIVPPRAVREDELSRVQARLDKFEQDPSADPAFLQKLRAERDTLEEGLDAAPQGVAVATFDQVKITCKLPVDEAGKKHLVAYNDWVSAQNEKLFAGVVPPPPAKGESSYVGTAECEGCHDEAVAFWKSTVHAGAYQTLVDTNQQYDLSCVGCHVTGFRKPGGSEVVVNAPLRDVQCETCHGPGSRHVEDPEKNGKPFAIALDAPESICAECHTPEHSDTFEYVAYLRDVLGEGHAAKRRERLGEGPTGRELRAAGLAKAGGSCKKM